MSFSTLPFLFYFLPAFLAVYYIVPARFRNAVLALGSLLSIGSARVRARFSCCSRSFSSTLPQGG